MNQRHSTVSQESFRDFIFSRKMPPSFFIHSAASFSGALTVMKELVENITFTLEGNTLTVFTMDSSHVCLVSASWRIEPREAFERVQFAVNLKNLLQALTFSKGGGVLIRINEDTVQIKVDETELSLKQLETDDLDINIEIEGGRLIDVDARDFSQIIKTFALIDDTIRIGISNDELVFETQNETFGKVKSIIVNQAGDDFKTLGFSTRYLVTFSKTPGELKIHLTESMPGVFAFESDDVVVKYYLAPKIEDEMNDM